MARTLIGTATTDGNGVATIDYQGTGTGKMNILATITIGGTTYTTTTLQLLDCIFLDVGKTGKSNTNYYNPSTRITATTDTEGKTLTNTSGSSGTYYPTPSGETPGTSLFYDTDYCIELDLLSYEGTGYIQVSDGTNNFFRSWSNLGCSGGEHIKIEVKNNSQAIYIDENETATYTGTNNFTDTNIRFNIANGANMKFANLEIYPI